jgi:aryl-alcohol dehydrogenase-like predicted oxidoreductase
VRKRPLGRTGLFVSEMSLGTWGLSGDGYGAVEPADAERVVRRALEMGMNLVDTADAYGGGKMEALLGKILRDHPQRDDIVVVTKGGTDRTTEPPRKRFDADWLRARVEASRKRLGRDVLDLYLLHNPSVDALSATEAVATMKDLVAKGTLRHWGVSAGNDEVARAAIDHGAEVIELGYNLFHGAELHRIAGDVMVAGTGVLARSVLLHGLLVGQWPKDREFPEGDHRMNRWTKLELEQRIDQLDALRFLVRGDVHSLRAAAVRFVLASSIVSSAVLGPRTVEQAEQLVRETGAGPRYLPDEQLLQLPRALSKIGILT